MPTPTYTALATVTLASASASITFGNIPATYKDLILVFRGTLGSATNAQTEIRINGDTGSNYSRVIAFGTSVSTFTSSADVFTSYRSAFGNNTNPFTNIVQFMDYSSTNKHKTILDRDSQANRVVAMTAARWINTAAITSLLFYSSSNLAAGSTLSLYGIIA
jgi:hypothetical protein